MRNAFLKKEHLIAIAIDLEKAYDTTWQRRIINILMNKGLKGRIVNFINNFFANRTFQARANNVFSGTGCGVILDTTVKTYKLSDNIKGFTTEAYGILKALEFIQKSPALRFLIATDSISVISAISNIFNDHPLI